MRKKNFLLKIVLLFNLGIIFYTKLLYAQIILVNELIQKAQMVKAYKAKSTLTYDSDEKKFGGEIEIIFKEDKGFKVHIHSIHPYEEKIIFLTDFFYWTYIPFWNRVLKVDMNKCYKELEQDFVRWYMFDTVSIRAPFSYRNIKKESAKFIGIDYKGREKNYVFEVLVENYSPDYKDKFYRNGKIWIGEDGLLRKMVIYGKNYREVFSAIFTDVVLNPQIPDSEFQFIPPQDSEIIDITEEWLTRLKLIKGLRERESK